MGERTFEDSGIILTRTKQLTWGMIAIFRYLLESHIKVGFTQIPVVPESRCRIEV